MKQGQDIAAKFPGILIIHQKVQGMHKPRHEHEDHEIFIPLSGEIHIQLEDQLLKAGPGKMIYLPPGIEHSFSSSSDSEGERLICLMENKTWQKYLGGDFPASTLPAGQLSKELLFHLLLHPKTKATRAMCETLVQTLSDLLENNIKPELIHLLGKIKDDRLKKSINLIQAAFTEKISMDKLAKDAGLSTRSFNRLFLDELGLTPKQIMTFYRIEKAKDLLLMKKSVTDVALDVGYQSVSQFITTFRSVTGQLPSEFRA